MTSRSAPIHDLDPERWGEYRDLILESLWLLGPRANHRMHTPEYWGNFVPQIPYQAMRRFTRQGELVIDLFAGSGTTLIEAKRLGRFAIGVELIPSVARQARRQIAREENPCQVMTTLLVGDSASPRTADRVRAVMARWGFSGAQLLILHPPYHDIIRFSEDPRDLSNAPTEEAF